ncbi:hypothetical protein U1Q18_000951 [Sarracenia purpurea var. burkii]
MYGDVWGRRRRRYGLVGRSGGEGRGGGSVLWSRLVVTKTTYGSDRRRVDVLWYKVLTNHSTSPFAEEMYEKIKEILMEYKVVMNRWPQYSLILETAVANVERAIIKALEKQHSDVLTPLKDSIPKRLGMQVQKLTGRQSIAIYSVPSQVRADN